MSKKRRNGYSYLASKLGLEDMRFNQHQWRVIQQGYNNGLTIDEINMFATGDFDSYQMREICDLLIDEELLFSQINVIARPHINPDKMAALKEAFKSGMDDQIVKRLADNPYSEEQITEIIKASKQAYINDDDFAYFLYENRTVEDMQKQIILLNPEIKESKKITENLNAKQVEIYYQASQKGLTKQQLTIIGNPEYSPEKMNEICDCFLSGKITDNQVKYYAENFDDEQIGIIREGIVNPDIDYHVVKYCTDHKFTSDKMQIVLDAAERGSSIDDIKSYAENYSADKLDLILSSIRKYGYDNIQARLTIEHPELTKEKIEAITCRNGITPDVLRYALQNSETMNNEEFELFFSNQESMPEKKLIEAAEYCFLANQDIKQTIKEDCEEGKTTLYNANKDTFNWMKSHEVNKIPEYMENNEMIPFDVLLKEIGGTAEFETSLMGPRIEYDYNGSVIYYNMKYTAFEDTPTDGHENENFEFYKESGLYDKALERFGKEQSVTEKLDILADGKRNKINQHDRGKGDDDGAR